MTDQELQKIMDNIDREFIQSGYDLPDQYLYLILKSLHQVRDAQEEKLKIAREALKSMAAWLDHGDLDSPSKEALIAREALEKIKEEE